MGDERVHNLPSRFVCLQTGLRRIGDLLPAVDQNVVPGLVALWLTSIGKIPVVVGLTGQVKGHDHTPIVIAPVTDELTRLKLGLLRRLDALRATQQLLNLLHLRFIRWWYESGQFLFQRGTEGAK